MSYRGGEPGHFWPKLAGWFLVPAASSLATFILAPVVLGKKIDPNTLTAADRNTIATLGGVCHALGVAGSWYASDHLFDGGGAKDENGKSIGAGSQAFFRGGMWSEMVSTLFAVGYLGMADAPGVAPPPKPATISGGPVSRLGDPRTHMAAMVSLLTGGAIPAPPKQNAWLLAAHR